MTRLPLFLDGRVAIDNNSAERSLKPVVLGRKNFLFAGSNAGGEIVADTVTIIKTAKLSSLNSQDHLADVLARINDHITTAWTNSYRGTGSHWLQHRIRRY